MISGPTDTPTTLAYLDLSCLSRICTHYWHYLDLDRTESAIPSKVAYNVGAERSCSCTPKQTDHSDRESSCTRQTTLQLNRQHRILVLHSSSPILQRFLTQKALISPSLHLSDHRSSVPHAWTTHRNSIDNLRSSEKRSRSIRAQLSRRLLRFAVARFAEVVKALAK